MSVIFSAAETAAVAVTVSKSVANDSNLDIETSGFGGSLGDGLMVGIED
jgi:hypothetical protein